MSQAYLFLKVIVRGWAYGHRLAVLLLAMVFPLSAMAAAPAMVDEIKTISILADSSLSLPITKIIQAYSSDKQQAAVAAFVAVNQQEQAVTEGVGYDVLITARPKLLEVLKQQGLVDIYTESVVAQNRLVLAAAAGTSFAASLSKNFPLADIIFHMNWRVGLVVGNPETLLQGTVAREVLRYYDVLGDLEPYTVYEKEIAQMVRMIREEKILGFLYDSDVKNVEGVRVVDMVPLEAHQPITYVAVVLAGDRMEQSREFVSYLKQPQSQRMFEQFGFHKP